MAKMILTFCLAMVLMWGIFAPITPALARRGADDSLERLDDRGKGRGRGRDDFLEDNQHRGRGRGKHHVQGEDHRRGRGLDEDRNRVLQDDSTSRDGKRGQGLDDR
jgi:hypothetical protein